MSDKMYSRIPDNDEPALAEHHPRPERDPDEVREEREGECLTVSRLYFQDKNGPTIVTMLPHQKLSVDYALDVYIDGERLEGVWAGGIPPIERNGTG